MEIKVIQYLLSLGFELQPCYVPLNDKESFKRNIYLMINEKSNKLFRLINKIWPIKFKLNRDDKSIWFILRDEITKRGLIEIEFKPKSDEHIKSMRFCYDNFDYSKWSFRICHGPYFTFIDDDFFYLYSDQEPVCEIECHFNQIPILKQLIREMKLKSILHEETNSK